MCVGAILQARIPVVCFGARDPKGGAMGGVLDLFWEDFNHRPAVTAGILEPECAALLEAFFAKLRQKRPDGCCLGQSGDSKGKNRPK